MNKIKILSLASIALLMVSCGDKEKDAANTEAQKPQVKIVKATSEDIAQTETYTATVESDVKNNISANQPLRIEKIFVEVGDIVSKGQVLVQLDASNLNQVKFQLDNAKVEFSRAEALYKIGGISKSVYDQAKTQVDILSTQLSLLSTNAKLVAPTSGVVTARNYDNGDMANGPILTIEQTNPVKVLVNISENYYKQTKKGMTASIELDAYEGETFDGKVTIVYPSIDPVSHTFKAEITINNQQQRVRPGMFARATVNFGETNHILVPDEAIVKQIGAGDRYVYTYKDGKVSYDKVELGKHIGKKYEIISGVAAGQEVVVAGQARLANGKEVEVVK